VSRWYNWLQDGVTHSTRSFIHRNKWHNYNEISIHTEFQNQTQDIMIQVYYAYTSILQKINKQLLINQLSKIARIKYEGYKRKEDKDLLLTSAYLLSQLLIKTGNDQYKIQDLQYSLTGRPSFKGAMFDFNISHTATCAVLAFSDKTKLGVDIEYVKPIDFNDFSTIFTKEIWHKIYSSENKLKCFYDYWTLYESAVKADGRGIVLVESGKLMIIGSSVFIEGEQWYTHPILIDFRFSCTLSSRIQYSEILVQEMIL
jgi:4'-phosphopantetheinyl transferase